MEFKIELEKLLKSVYGISIEDADAEIDSYYYNKVSFEEVEADKDVCVNIKKYIEQYSLERGIELCIKDLQELSDKVLAFAINYNSSEMHYNRFVSECKNKVITDFIKAEKALYESEYLVKAGIYEERYNFDLNVNIEHGCVEMKGNLNTLDVLVMACQREYDITKLNEFRDDFGSTHEQRFVNGMDNLGKFEDIFDVQENIFKQIDLSHLYGQCDDYEPAITYELFENWMATIEASELLGL